MHKFKDIICETFIKNKGNIIEYINSNKIKYKDLINVENVANKYNVYVSVYDLNYYLNYDNLEKLVLDIKII